MTSRQKLIAQTEIKYGVVNEKTGLVDQTVFEEGEEVRGVPEDLMAHWLDIGTVRPASEVLDESEAQELDELRAENQELREQLAQAEQDNNALKAKLAAAQKSTTPSTTSGK